MQLLSYCTVSTPDPPFLYFAFYSYVLRIKYYITLTIFCSVTVDVLVDSMMPKKRLKV